MEIQVLNVLMYAVLVWPMFHQDDLGVTSSNPFFRDIVEYREMFDSAEPEKLQELSVHTDASVSTRAIWEQYKRAADEQGSIQQKYVFLGFLKAKLGVRIPTFWLNAIENHSAIENAFDLKPENYFKHRINGIKCNYEISVEGKKLTLDIPGGKLKVTNEFSDELEFGKQLSIDTNGKIGIVVFHSSQPTTHKVMAVDQKTREHLWTANCNASISKSTGSTRHISVPLIFENKVVIFGLSSKVAYVELFDLKDGKMLFRFSSDF